MAVSAPLSTVVLLLLVLMAFCASAMAVPSASTTPPPADTNAAVTKTPEELYEDATEVLVTTSLRQGIQQLQQAARMGSPSAMNLLAVMHAHGVGVPFDEAKAVLHHTMASAAGNVESTMALSTRYEHGISVGQSCQQSAKYARAAASATMSEYRVSIPEKIVLTRLDESAGEYRAMQGSHSNQEMIALHVLRADRGDAAAMMFLGQASMHGLFGMKRDAKAAMERFTAAIRAGNKRGHAAMGQLYAQSVSSLIAARSGLETGASSLVPSSRSDESTPTSADTKTPLAVEAASPDGGDSMIILTQADTDDNGAAGATAESTGAPSESDAEVATPIELTEVTIDRQLELSINRAHHHFTKGAESHDDASLNGLGFLHATGVLSPDRRTPDFDKAAYYFDLSAKQGNAEGMYNYAVLRLHGKGGIVRDPAGAFQGFQKAAALGSIMARFQLGSMLLKGVPGVVSPNCHQAMENLKMVAQRGVWMRRAISAKEKYVEGEYMASLLEYLTLAEAGESTARYNAAVLLQRRRYEITNFIHSDVEASLAAEGGSSLGSTGSSDQVTIRPSSGSDAAIDVSLPSTSTVLPVYTEATVKAMLSSMHYSLVLRSALEGNVNSHIHLGDLFYYGHDDFIHDEDAAATSEEATASAPTKEVEPASGNSGEASTASAEGARSPTATTGNRRYRGSGYRRKLKILPFEIKKNFKQAAEHYAIAASHHLGQASFNLGYMYQFGLGVPQDFHLAKRYFDKSAEDTPQATYLVKAALIALNAHWWAIHFFALDAAVDATGTAATPASQGAIQQQQQPASPRPSVKKYSKGPHPWFDETSWLGYAVKVYDYLNYNFMFGLTVNEFMLVAGFSLICWLMLMRHHAN